MLILERASSRHEHLKSSIETDIMTNAICISCVDDEYLREALEVHFEHLECSVCGKESGEAVIVESLAAVIELVMREYFVQGQDEKYFGRDDSEWWEQSGEPLPEIIRTVTGQYFNF